jgi:hypothetical protein
LTDQQTCQIDLDAKNKLIRERLLGEKPPPPEPEWWQSGTVVVGGVVLSVGVGSILTWALLKK